MDYSKLTPLLVQALNALRDEKDGEIRALGAENDALRADNDMLSKRLDALEQFVEQIAMAQQELIK